MKAADFQISFNAWSCLEAASSVSFSFRLLNLVFCASKDYHNRWTRRQIIVLVIGFSLSTVGVDQS